MYTHIRMMRYMYRVTPNILLKSSLWETIDKNLDSLSNVKHHEMPRNTTVKL